MRIARLVRPLPVLLLCAVAAGCATATADPTPDPGSTVRYALDMTGQTVEVLPEVPSALLTGWTSVLACAWQADLARAESLRFEDGLTPDWDLDRDGGTPPPRTGSGMGIALDVEHQAEGTFAVALEVGGRRYTGSAPDDGAAVGFHHVAYATPPELLAIEGLDLVTDDGAVLTLTGTASFPSDCTGT
ncbi:MAG: hypothetical protein U0869_13045 [Chloroflexota bacterium]